MSTPSPRKPAPAPAAPGGAGPPAACSSPAACSPPEQVERVRRAQKVNGLTAEQAHHPARLRERGADRAGPRRPRRPPLREDQPARPRPRRGHQGDRRPLRAQARHGRDQQDRHQRSPSPSSIPSRPSPLDDIQRVTGLDVERVVATRSDVETVNKGFYDLKSSLQTAEKQLSAEPPRHRGPREPGVPLPGLRGARPRGRARWSRPSTTSSPTRSSSGPPTSTSSPSATSPWCACASTAILHDVHLIPRIVYEAVVSRIKLLSGCQPRGEAAAPGRTHQARAGRAGDRAARLAPCPPPSGRRRCCASSTPTSC